MSFEKFEPAQYRTPEPGEVADPTTVAGLEDQNKNSESTEKASKKTPDYTGANKMSPTITADMNTSVINDQNTAKNLLPKDDSIWPPPTIESSVGGTEGGSSTEVRKI